MTWSPGSSGTYVTWSPGSPGPALNSQLGMQDAVKMCEMTKARSPHLSTLLIYFIFKICLGSLSLDLEAFQNWKKL